MSAKQVIGGPLTVDGRELSVSRAIRTGDFVFVTGQVPMRDGKLMTDGSIEDQTRACHSLRTASGCRITCLGQFGALCIPRYFIEGVLVR